MKKLIVGLAVVLGATLAQAEYLYWQVQDAGNTFNGHTIAGYRVVADNTGSYSGSGVILFSTYVTDEDSWSDPSTATMSPAVAQAGAYANLTYQVGEDPAVDTYTSDYSYYIEIVGYDSSVYGAGTGVIGVSEALTYAQAHSHTTGTLESISSVPTAWTGGTYAAPEPTSGLLLLVGASLLALKRRKV